MPTVRGHTYQVRPDENETHYGWSCSCGAGSEPTFKSLLSAREAADSHLPPAVMRRDPFDVLTGPPAKKAAQKTAKKAATAPPKKVAKKAAKKAAPRKAAPRKAAPPRRPVTPEPVAAEPVVPTPVADLAAIAQPVAGGKPAKEGWFKRWRRRRRERKASR